MLSTEHAAWLGAWIDGEGSVMLNKRTFSGARASHDMLTRYPHYRPVVVVACFTHEPLGEALHAIVSGQIYQHRAGGDIRTPRKRTQWTFRWNVSQIREYLPQVLPWLVIKPQQARWLLEAMEIQAGYRPGCDVQAYRDSLDVLYHQIKSANTRGRTELT